MRTEYRNEKLEFQDCGARQVVAEFGGGTITSDGGVLLLKGVEANRKIINRLELRSDDLAKDGRYKKIALDEKKVDDFFIDVFVQAHEEAPKLIVIDLDATDDPLHGA